ncbi:ribulose-phosphate 3-epimerase [Calderihabitans maritimus]|uniref:Ribulose-phosphate 3-epimerase n=1 Tax=Calderihabitans maritimus TaxID=1246530 RepID=A0A1Z5HPQ2_9FIRM|nr:ribulose-phosphate 3-epimerase [Calderihabitans maritimus]GAW91418.1 ribulose-phosphate 3-epimerase [Calderihabitans maritimus]
MVKIAPSILSADFSRLAEQVQAVERAGVDYLHLDVMDGHFVPNITFGPGIIKSLRQNSQLPFDVHLMIDEPERYLESFVAAGADLISVHVEACRHLHRTLETIKELGARPAVALNPATPLSSIEHVLAEVDMVLLMTVNPGFGGQKFIPAVIRKIVQLKKMLDDENLNIDIEVDGGINAETALQAVRAGANVLVAGSAIFGANDIEKAVRTLRMSVNT